MAEPELGVDVTDDELLERYAQTETLSSRQIGQLLYELRPSIDTGLAGEETRLLVDLLCVALASRSSAPTERKIHAR